MTRFHYNPQLLFVQIPGSSKKLDIDTSSVEKTIVNKVYFISTQILKSSSPLRSQFLEIKCHNFTASAANLKQIKINLRTLKNNFRVSYLLSVLESDFGKSTLEFQTSISFRELQSDVRFRRIRLNKNCKINLSVKISIRRIECRKNGSCKNDLSEKRRASKIGVV